MSITDKFSDRPNALRSAIEEQEILLRYSSEDARHLGLEEVTGYLDAACRNLKAALGVYSERKSIRRRIAAD